MDPLLRWREPLTVIVLVAVAVRLVIGLAMSIAGSAYVAGQMLAVAAVALAVWCTRTPPTRRARTLLLVSVAAAGTSVVVEFAWLAVRAVFTTGGVETFVALVPELVLPTLASVVGLAVWRATPIDVTDNAPAAVTPGPPPSVELERQPSWQPDQASGAAWTTAGEAAAGGPTAGWGQVGESTWQPIPRDPAPPEQSHP